MSTPAPDIALDELGERVSLPSGGWIQLRHLDDLRSKHRNHVTAAMGDSAYMRIADVTAMQYAVAEVCVTAWHLPYLEDAPLPWDARVKDGLNSVLQELTVRDENAMYEALEPVLELFNPKRVTPDDHADPDSPTAPAAD